MLSFIRLHFRELLLLTAFFSFLYFFNLGGYGFIDPNESFYAGAAKEMLVKGDWSTPILFGQPLFEKPVLVYWAILSAYRLFGVNEWAARFWFALFGVGTVLLTYGLANLLYRRKQIAFTSAVVIGTSLEFVILSKIILTDMMLAFFVMGAFLCFWAGYVLRENRQYCWTWMFWMMAFGFLAKGPLSAIIVYGGIFAFLASRRELVLWREFPWKRGFLIFLVFGASWYIWMTIQHGEFFLKQTFIHENLRRFFVAEHEEKDRFFYYPLTILAGFFPWSLFVVMGLVRAFKRTSSQTAFLLSSFGFCFVFLSFAKSKLPSYIFPVFPVLAILAGLFLYKFYRSTQIGFGIKWWIKFIVPALSAIMPLVLITVLFFYDKKMGYGEEAEWLKLSLILAVPSMLFVFFWSRRKLKAAFFSQVGLVAVLILFCFGIILPKLDPFLSSRHSARLYQSFRNQNTNPFLLVSKIYVRGLYYYANLSPNHIGVFTSNPDIVFYTKHPIRIWSKRQDLESLKKDEFPVLCFMRPKEFRLLKERAGEGYRLDVLESGSERVFAKLERP